MNLRPLIPILMVFVLFNSLYFIEGQYPVVSVSQLNLENESTEITTAFEIHDFQVFEENIYTVESNPTDGVYDLRGYDMENTVLFAFSIASSFVPIMGVNEQGIILAIGAGILNEIQLRHYDFTGQEENFVILNRDLSNTIPIELEMDDADVYLQAASGMASGSIDGINEFMIAYWNIFDTESSSLLRFRDMPNLYYGNFFWEDGDLYSGIYTDTRTSISYYLLSSGNAIFNSERETEKGITPLVEIISKDESYMVQEDFGDGHMIITEQLFSEKRHIYEVTTGIVYTQTLRVNHEDDVLIITSVRYDQDTKIVPVLYTIEETATKLHSKEFNIEALVSSDNDEFLFIQEVIIYQENIYIAADYQNLGGKIFNIRQGYQSQLLLESVPTILQFNILPLIIAAIYGYYLYRKEKIEPDLDDLQYPSFEEQ